MLINKKISCIIVYNIINIDLLLHNIQDLSYNKELGKIVIFLNYNFSEEQNNKISKVCYYILSLKGDKCNIQLFSNDNNLIKIIKNDRNLIPFHRKNKFIATNIKFANNLGYINENKYLNNILDYYKILIMEKDNTIIYEPKFCNLNLRVTKDE